MQSERLLQGLKPAKSTLSLLQPDSGREILGPLLDRRGKHAIPAPALRDFLQMIGNAFPVGKVVERNTHGSSSPVCKLCGQCEESYTHISLSKWIVWRRS